jgi:hypothetical protein
MLGEPVTSATTLAVLLGAGEFPSAPRLSHRPSLARSAEAFREYLLDPGGFGLAPDQILDLFDSADPPDRIDDAIHRFLADRLRERPGPRDLILYYVGHGGFATSNSDYFLAIRNTRGGAGEGPSSLRMRDLGAALREGASALRRHVIIDACYSAEAYEALKQAQTSLEQLVKVKVFDALPRRGSALLCSSGASDASWAPEGSEYTMFSSGVLHALRESSSDGPLSLKDIRDIARVWIEENFEPPRVLPELHSPDQSTGDVAYVPLFPVRRRPGTGPVVQPVGDEPEYLGRTAREWERELRSADAGERREAAWALGQIGAAARKALPALLEAMRIATDARFEFVDAVGRIAPDDTRALLPLSRALGDDERTRTRAADLLARHGAAALTLLFRAIEDPARREAACRALSMVGAPAVERLLEIASMPESSAWASALHACMGRMAEDAHAELVRVARGRPALAVAALKSIAGAASTSADARDFALEILSRHIDSDVDTLASSVAFRNTDEPARLVDAIVAALAGADSALARRAAELLPLTGHAAVAPIREVLRQDDPEVWQRLLPAIAALGERAGELGPDLAAAGAGKSRELVDQIRVTVMRISPFGAPVTMLRDTLVFGPDELKQRALELALAGGIPGLAAVLAGLSGLDAPLREQAEVALRAVSAESAADIASAVQSSDAVTLDFCASEPAFATAAVAHAVQLLDGDRHWYDLDDAPAWLLPARRVLSAAFQASPGAVVRALDPVPEWKRPGILRETGHAAEMIANLVPLLEEGSLRDRVFGLVRSFREDLRRDGASAAAVADALARLRGDEARARAAVLRRALRLGPVGKLARTLQGLGSAALLPVGVVGGLLLLPLGIVLAFRRPVVALAGLLLGGGGAVAAGYYGPFGDAPLAVGLLAAIAALTGMGGGVAARAVLAFIFDDEPKRRGAALAGLSTAIVASVGTLVLVARELPFDPALLAVFGPIAGILGAIFGAIDRRRAWR